MEILVIEDSAQCTQLIKNVLEAAGKPRCIIHCVKSLSQSLQALSQRSFDAVLLDLDLPDSSGLQTLVHLKPSARQAPVIVLADPDKPAPLRSAAQHGAMGFVSKSSLDAVSLHRAIRFSRHRFRREVAAGHAESKYRTFIDTLKDAYYEVDLNGNYTYINDTVLKHMGRPREALIGMNNREYTPPDVARQVYATFVDVFQTGNSGKLTHTPLIRPDGSVIMVEIRVTLLRDDEGEPVGFGGISRDVTDKVAAQKALEVSETKYRGILDSIEDGYFETDLKGRIIFFNESISTLFGYTLSEHRQTDHYKYMDAANAQKVAEAYQHIYETGQSMHSIQYEVTSKAGKSYYIESAVSLMKDETGTPVGFRGVARDISSRKTEEQALFQAKQTADLATKAKSEFLANMSHEIRTPLNGIIGMYNLLASTELTPEQTDYVNTGKHSADGLLAIINDVLDYSKIEAGKLDIETIRFNIRSTIEDMVLLPASRAHAKGLEFVCHIDHEVPSLLKGDPGRLRQIVHNLAMNAVKFTTRGEVALFVSLEEENDTHARIRITVKDSGIGISKNNQSRLFRSFQQVDSSAARKYGGTGLGLAIARRLTELMGGRMGVESEKGQGAAFWLTINFEKVNGAQNDALVAPEIIREKRILIVDDNKTNLAILDGYLKLWGCTCDHASSAVHALTLMRALAKAGAPYDLVISDLLMPRVDGAEFGRQVKADPALKETLMIVLTSQGIRGDAAEMKQIGFSGYLTKPVRPAQLFDCMLTVLSRRQNGSMPKEPTPLITNHYLSDSKRCNIRILLVDDNAINRKLAIHLLDRFGFNAKTALNGKEAIAELASNPYDIVLMDIEMPEMDGYEATRIIRSKDDIVLDPQVPIIAMTARATEKDRQECLAAGMNDYIAKPIDPKELLRAIEGQIKTSFERSVKTGTYNP